MNEVINSIGQLWKLLTVIIIGFIIFIYREQIKAILSSRNLKFKKGDTEIELSGKNIGEQEQKIAQEQTVATIQEVHEDILGEISISNLEKLFKAYNNRDIESLKKIMKNIDEGESDKEEKVKCKSYYYGVMYCLGDREALNKLYEMLESYGEEKPLYVLIANNIAKVYIYINQYDNAYKIYERAIEACEDIERRAELICESAVCLLELKLDEEAIKVLISSINEDRNNKDTFYIYYKRLAYIYEKLGEKELKIIALEKALQYSSNSIDTIFDLAYEYSIIKYKNLTLLHYNNLLKFSPNNSSALNNKGVVAAELGLNGIKVNSYEDAVRNGNTLAAANIAYDYIEKGFYKEAKEILEKAQRMENEPHINVNKAITRLNEVIISEKDKEKEIVDEALIQQRFFTSYGEAYFNLFKDLNLANSKWRYNESIIEIKQNDDKIEAKWSYGSAEYKLEGNIVNRAIKTKLNRKEYSYITRLYEFKEIGIAYMYMGNDDDKLRVFKLENEKNEICEFNRFFELG